MIRTAAILLVIFALLALSGCEARQQGSELGEGLSCIVGCAASGFFGFLIYDKHYKLALLCLMACTFACISGCMI